MTRSANHHVSASGDPVLADHLEQLTAAIAKGDEAAIEALLQGHPEHAERLRAILPTLEMLTDLNSSAGHSTPQEENQGGVLGDYRIGREIGRGGMGVVYEAEQLSLRRRVALKMLQLAGMLDERALARFRNEAQAAAGLHHPHIVPIYGVGCERGVHYYAMQFVDGVSLDRWIGAMRAADLPSGAGAARIRKRSRFSPPSTMRKLPSIAIAASRSWAFKPPKRCTTRTNGA